MWGLEAFFTSRKNINKLFASLGGFISRNILDQFFLRHFPFDKLTNDWRSRWTTFVPYTNWICMSELTCAEGHRLRVVPYFSSGIVERAKQKRAWKSSHARKGDTCWSLLLATSKIMLRSLGSLILSFTCNLFAYFKFHSDWGRVIGKIKQNELDCHDTAPLSNAFNSFDSTSLFTDGPWRALYTFMICSGF